MADTVVITPATVIVEAGIVTVEAVTVIVVWRNGMTVALAEE